MNTHHTHVFDHLRTWATMSDAELVSRADDAALAIMNDVVTLLTSGRGKSRPVRREDFCDVVRRMHEIYVSQSRALGDAILRASELRDMGETLRARDVYTHFLGTCQAPFYRRIAEGHLRDLG